MADLYYIEDGYYDSGYFVYTADAGSGLTADFSVVCDATVIAAGVTVEASGSWTIETTLDTVTSKIIRASADIAGAFAPTLIVEVFKNSFAVLDVPTTLTADAVANRSITQTLDTIASLNAMADKYRENAATLDATSSLNASANTTIRVSADLTATSVLDVTYTRIISASADLSNTSVLDVTYTRTIPASADLSTDSTLSTDISVTRFAEADLEVDITQTADYTRIISFSIDLTAAFDPTLSATAQLAGVALLESQSTFEVIGSKFAGYQADLDATSQTSATAYRIQPGASDLVSETSLTLNIDYYVGFDADLTSESSLTADEARTRNLDASLDITSQASTEVSKITGFTSDLSVASSLTALVGKIQPALADLSSTATTSIEPVKTAISGLVEIVTTASQEVITNAVSTFRMSADGAFSPTVTANVSVDRGSDMSVTATVSAIVGVIKQISIGSGIGVDATSEPSATASPYLRYGTSTSVTPTPGFVNVSDSVPQSGKFVISMWMVNPIGYVFDADSNREIYTGSGHPGNSFNNSIQIETFSGVPYLRYFGNTGVVEWPLGTITANVYDHYLISVDITKSTNSQKYRLFRNGQEVTTKTVYQIGGAGVGQIFTAMTTPFDIKITTHDQYLLMMNTSGGSSKAVQVNSAGYGDSNGVKDARGGLTQFWWDYDADSYDIDNADYRAKFYDGNYVDLGLNGTATGLPQPKHYVRLLNYQDIAELGTKRSFQENWQWKNLTSIGGDYYTEGNYSPTIDQNSTGILQGVRATFSLSGQVVTVLETVGSLSAAFSLTAQVNYRPDASIAATSVSTVTANTQRFGQGVAALDQSFSLFATPFRIQESPSDLTATVTLEAVIGYVKPVSADLDLEFTLYCDGTEIQAIQGSADLASEFTLTADVNETQSFTSTPNSEFTLVCDATVKPPIRITADLAIAATVTAELTRVLPFGSIMSSEFTVFADTTKLKGAVVALSTEFTTYVLAGQLIGATADLQVQAFELSDGEVLNLAPELTLYVPAESRTRRVLPENRIYALDGETRARKVLPESRIITIEQQTEVNII
jgi:hypothetical protein